MSETERKLLEISLHTVDELMQNSTIHPKREILTSLQVRTMTLEVLHNESLKLLEELKKYPNIVILQEYVKRTGYFVNDTGIPHDAS